jgi:hypothetical protein
MTGWSETTATNAPVQDEAVQAILGMNQKHILLPCPGILQPLLCPKIFPSYLLPLSYLLPSLLPTFALLPPSPHFLLTPSLKLRRAHELE